MPIVVSKLQYADSTAGAWELLRTQYWNKYIRLLLRKDFEHNREGGSSGRSSSNISRHLSAITRNQSSWIMDDRSYTHTLLKSRGSSHCWHTTFATRLWAQDSEDFTLTSARSIWDIDYDLELKIRHRVADSAMQISSKKCPSIPHGGDKCFKQFTHRDDSKCWLEASFLGSPIKFGERSAL